ncbi:MAG: SemiSWEET transporter [Paracoccaceae bacterium]
MISKIFNALRTPEWVERYEGAMIIIGIVGPFATLPQLVKLYLTHSHHASGQSLLTWAMYFGLSVLWFVYGLVTRKKAIYFGNGLSAVMNFLMVVGIMIHAGMTF